MSIYNMIMGGSNPAKNCNATAADILSGKTAAVGKSVVTGTMVDRRNKTVGMCGYEQITVQAHPQDASQALVTIPNQYGVSGYIGTGSAITGNIANLNASNIRKGVKIGRVNGDSSNCIIGTCEALPAGALVSSTNGVTISRYTTRVPSHTDDYTRMTAGADNSVLLGSVLSYYSSDGKTFSACNTSNLQVSCYVPGAGWIAAPSGSALSITGNSSTTSSNYYVSTNGISWTQKNFPRSLRATCIATDGGNTVVVPISNASFYMYSLDKGNTWKESTGKCTGKDCIYNKTAKKWFFFSSLNSYYVRNNITDTADATSTTLWPSKTSTSETTWSTLRLLRQHGNYTVIIGMNSSSSSYKNRIWLLNGTSQVMSGTGSYVYYHETATNDLILDWFVHNNNFYYITNLGNIYKSTSITGSYTLYKTLGIYLYGAAYSNGMITMVTALDRDTSVGTNDWTGGFYYLYL